MSPFLALGLTTDHRRGLNIICSNKFLPFFFVFKYVQMNSAGACREVWVCGGRYGGGVECHPTEYNVYFSSTVLSTYIKQTL